MNAMLEARIVAASIQRPLACEHGCDFRPARMNPASQGSLTTALLAWANTTSLV